jgi:hypothetical protein
MRTCDNTTVYRVSRTQRTTLLRAAGAANLPLDDLPRHTRYSSFVDRLLFDLRSLHDGKHLMRIREENARAAGVEQTLHLTGFVQRRGEQILDRLIRQGAE